MERSWDSLPATALVSVFCKSTIDLRIRVLPLVCKAWRHASEDPQCWESMLPETTSLEEAFIKSDSPYETFLNPFNTTKSSVNTTNASTSEETNSLGLLRLQNLVSKSRGRITSLYLSPFLSDPLGHASNPNDDELLFFIAKSCPNLKHLSLEGSSSASEEAMCQVAFNCKQLELINFSVSSCFSDAVLEELGSCCPGLRGIRRVGALDYYEASVIATSLRDVRLLNLARTTLCDDGLSAIVYGCYGLEHLDITACPRLTFDLYATRKATAQVSEFFHNQEVSYEEDREQRYFRGEDGVGDWGSWPY